MIKEYVEHSLIGMGAFNFGGVHAGNATAARIAYATEKKTVPNMLGGGGNIAANERISEATLSITVSNLSAENIALGLQATINRVIAVEVVDEQLVANVNGLASTEHMMDISKPITVKTSADQPIAASNYTATAAGIRLKVGSNHVDGDNIKVSYTMLPAAVLQAGLSFGKDIPVILDGMNDDNGDPYVWKIHRWKVSPTSGMDLISADYSSLELTGEILADPTKPQGKSRHFEMQMVERN